MSRRMAERSSSARIGREFDLCRESDGMLPLGERIKKFVLAKIDGGTWPEGHRIPSETELALVFRAARMTVHGALRDLARAGILSRRPGAGTRVAPRRAHSTLLEIRNIHDEIVERGHRHSAKVHRLAAEPCDLATATELELAPGTEVFHSVIVHFEDGRPIQLEDRFVTASFAPGYRRQNFARATPNEYLMGLGPLEEVEQVIQSLMPDKATRTLLKIPEGEPVLHVRRRTWSGGAVVTSARLIHPGFGYSLVGRFRVDRNGLS